MSGWSHRFLGITSTFWEVNVSCSRTQHGALSEDRTLTSRSGVDPLPLGHQYSICDVHFGIIKFMDFCQNSLKTSSPKGNNAHLRAIIQSEKKWKHQFFRHLRAVNSVVRGRILPNFKLIQALMYFIIT